MQKPTFRTSIALIITVAWIAGVIWYVSQNLQRFSQMEPNAFGDFFAGVFSPLAFTWLVIGYFQQGEDLKLNTAALRLQAEELKKSVAHQEALVEVTRDELRILSEKQKIDSERELREMQPYFKLVPDSYGVSNGKVGDIRYKLYNEGPRAETVSVTSDASKIETSAPKSLSDSEHISISLWFNPPVESFHVDASYVDLLGNYHVKRFRIFVTSGGLPVSVSDADQIRSVFRDS
jgi:hypothetical protein